MTLECLQSDLLATHHGFFTRQGGASSGIFTSLNCGQGSSDQREMVTINRARVAEYMAVTPHQMAGVHQIHSARAISIDAPLCEPEQADAMATAQPGLALAVLSADCQPVLFFDPSEKVIAAAHAGWRGALDGVLEATVEEMVGLGAERGNIIAAIGPCISQRAYEVGAEFIERFTQDDPANGRFFANGNGDKYQFDLVGFSLNRLRNAGVSKAEWIGHCTYSDPNRFYSYRRSVHQNEADYGRLISVIRL